MLPITQIEDAIIKQIASAKLPYLRFVGSYGGELMGDWQEVIRALPAVWVAFKDASAQECKNTARTRYQARLTYTTIVADRSASSEAATRKGGPGTPFKAGLSCAGDPLTNDDWSYAFRVNAPADAPRVFKAGQSVAGEALRTWGDSILECIINQRKPAHAVALVAYT